MPDAALHGLLTYLEESAALPSLFLGMYHT